MWHLFKLVQWNVSPQIIKLLRSFLTKRLFSVRSENSLSTLRQMSASVLQCSCPSPLLFTIYVNHMPSSSNIKINLFSDNTMYFCFGMSKHFAANRLQNHLEQTSKRLSDWRITINPAKSVAILFDDKDHANLKCLKINGQGIKWSRSIKHLGIIIDSKLKFSQHVNYIHKKSPWHPLHQMLNHHSPIPLKTKVRTIQT